MKRTELKKIYSDLPAFDGQTVTVAGWARSVRDSKAFGFIELNDGSCFKNTQIVFDRAKIGNYDEIAKQNVGASFVVTGKVVVTPENRQPFEINADSIAVEGKSSPDYPLQKKRHSMEFLREIAHLRPRTNTFSAVFRIRSEAAFAIHDYFHSRGFVYVHTPIITGSDCEGAGAMFQVTTLDLDRLTQSKSAVDYKKDFFEKKASLTVSGQLDAETYALAFSNVYTFGPTFRAERSNTVRHAAEFWMIEPEIAFADLEDDMELIEDCLIYCIRYCFENAPEEMDFFDKYIDNTLKERLNHVINTPFRRMEYTDAIEILKKAVEDGHPFENSDIRWGLDLQSEHEKYITEQIVKGPVFLINYPREIKSYYMRDNDDGKTVAACDLLVPGVGELVGGSQREERYDVLKKKMEEAGLDLKEYQWYLDLRKYGGCKHAGFGIGFDRLLMYISGMENIRDVEPFPRTYGRIDY